MLVLKLIYVSKRGPWHEIEPTKYNNNPARKKYRVRVGAATKQPGKMMLETNTIIGITFPDDDFFQRGLKKY